MPHGRRRERPGEAHALLGVHRVEKEEGFMERRRGFRTSLVGGLLVAIVGCGNGDRLVAGVGNSGNRLYTNPIDEVAEVLAETAAVPRVSDETLVQGFEAIQRRALEGDAEAVLILFRVAEEQRKQDE
jgi:hypothetical protein